MTSRARLSLVLATTLAAAPLAAAQQVLFRGGTDTVRLNVTVTDGASRLLPGLSGEDFQILEDGQPQEVQVFSRDPQPIALALLIDASTSMDQKLAVAQEGAVGFVRRLKPQDIAQITDFNNEIRIGQDFSNDVGALERAIRLIRTGGSTSMYNAIYSAFVELKRARSAQEARRQAIVVLSDGEDTTSLVTYEDVLDSAKRSEVAIYAIGLRAKDPALRRAGGFNEADYVMRTLSQETGGRAFFVEDIAQLPAVYTQIADELANQYLIGYTSKNQKRDGAWRQVSVRVTRPNTIARSKSGYYAPLR
jgi:Ca-activated chloride channel family protein